MNTSSSPEQARGSRVATTADVAEILRHLPGAVCTTDGSLQFKRKGGHTQQDDDLYIMRYSFRSDCVKIGRSHNPQRRRRDLEAGHNFRIEIVGVFPGKGFLERRVHERLAVRRSTEGSGTEWFDVDVATAIDAVRAEILAQSTPEAV